MPPGRPRPNRGPSGVTVRGPGRPPGPIRDRPPRRDSLSPSPGGRQTRGLSPSGRCQDGQSDRKPGPAPPAAAAMTVQRGGDSALCRAALRPGPRPGLSPGTSERVRGR
eukprot:768487-Hanusia_phi.AAC.3